MLLLVGVYFLYTANKEKGRRHWRNKARPLQENGPIAQGQRWVKKLSGQTEELTRLRKESEDLLRLRSEAQRLRDQTKQLTAQLATAQAQGAQAQQAQQQMAEKLANENQALRSQTEKIQQAQAIEQVKVQTDACVNNLRMIDGAKQTWALENKKTANDVPTMEEILPYLGRGTSAPPPVCPGGGTYSINAVGLPPTCNLPGHALAKQP